MSSLLNRRTVAHSLVTTLAVSAWFTTLPAQASPEWDIVGIRLGMTEAQVKAAMMAFEPKGKIIASNAQLIYSDKAQQHRTPSFLSSMELRVTRMSIEIPLKVWFSGPTGDVRVIAVRRQAMNIPNAPTGEQFMQGLIAKYGQPTAADSAGTPTWQAAGKPSCIRTSHGLDFNPFASVVVPPGKNDFGEAAAELARRQQGVGKGLLPADLKTCGSFLYYTGTRNNPANHFIAGLFDVGAIVATHQARNAWVEGLSSGAVKQREGQAQMPKL